MKKIILLLSLLVVGMVFSPVLAEEGFSIEVNFRNSVLTYENNNITLAFDFINGKKALSGIKYGVQLMDGDTVIDEKVYAEAVNLKGEETLSKKIKYIAPDFLQGRFSMQLVAKNEAGMSVAFNTVGDIILNGTGDYLEIDNSSCYLSIQGEELIKYNLGQGVDVAPEEILFLNCAVSNHFDGAVEFLPLFETNHRSTFGEKVAVASGGTDKVETLDAGETKEISFLIARPTIPQAYDAKLFLTDSINQTKLISNSVIAHYVVQGGSATFQNIQLDKESYLKGETARVVFFWTPSADSFNDSRIGEGTVLNDVVIEGVIEGCSDTFYDSPSDTSFKEITVEVPILKNCQNPTVSLSLKSGEQLLDEAILKIQDNQQSKYFFTFFVIVVIFILIIYGLLLFMKKKEKGVPLAILLFAVFGTIALLGGVNIVKASTTEAFPFSNYNNYSAFFTWDVDMSSNPIKVSYNNLSSSEDTGCNNARWTIANGYLNVYHDGVFEFKIPSGTKSFPKSATPGTHIVGIKFFMKGMAPIRDAEICFDQSNQYDYDYYYYESEYLGAYFKLKSPVPGRCSELSAPYYNCFFGITGSNSCAFDKDLDVGYREYTYIVADQTPSCTATWDDNNLGIIAPDSSTLSWNLSANTTEASYSCTGPVAGSGSLGVTNKNDSTVFTFPATPAGKETCTITVKNSAGVPFTCSDSLVIDPPPSPVVKLSCEASWSPSSIKAPSSSTITWSSSDNAVSARWKCTGPIDSKGWSVVPTNFSGQVSFSVAQTETEKTEKCIIEVSDGKKTSECYANLNIIGCTGKIPNGGTMCPLDDTGLTVSLPWTKSGIAQPSCTINRKCEYYLPSTPPSSIAGICGTADGYTFLATDTGYSPKTQCSLGSSNNTAFPSVGSSQSWYCIECAFGPCGSETYSSPCTASRATPTTPYSCTGTIPVGHEAYDSEESSNLTANTPWLLSSTDTATKCQYYSTCVSTTWTPSPATVCSGTSLTQTSNCGTTRSVAGTKSCPTTCTAAFNPIAVTSPGSSTLTWSSINATDIKYICTGPVAGGADYGVIPLNSPASPAVIFNFPYGPTDTESCIFTVKNNTNGAESTCVTNSSATGGGGGGGGCTVNCGTVVTPHAPECTLVSSDEDGVIFLGEKLTLTWTSLYANSGSINPGAMAITPVASGSIKVTPKADTSYVGTFVGVGGSTTCPTEPITVVVNPPEVGTFNVSSVETGSKPKANWTTTNIVRCNLTSNTGYSQTTSACSGVDCASVKDFPINKAVLQETTYTLTCSNPAGYQDTAQFTPRKYFTLDANPKTVEVDFVGGGATTTPPVNLEMVSFNGFRDLVTLIPDFSDLPESHGTEVNSVSLFPSNISFASNYNPKTALMEIFASYRFTGPRDVEVCDTSGTHCVTITVQSKKTTPIYEPI